MLLLSPNRSKWCGQGDKEERDRSQDSTPHPCVSGTHEQTTTPDAPWVCLCPYRAKLWWTIGASVVSELPLVPELSVELFMTDVSETLLLPLERNRDSQELRTPHTSALPSLVTCHRPSRSSPYHLTPMTASIFVSTGPWNFVTFAQSTLFTGNNIFTLN